MSFVGGLARRTTYLRQARRDSRNVLVVDTGGTLTGSTSDEDARADELIISALVEMGYDALNAGQTEIMSLSSALAQGQRPSPPTLIASNITASDSLILPSNRYLVREVSGVRVGLLGVTTAVAAVGHDGIAVEPPADALRSLVSEVRPKADIVIVLADMEQEEVDALAHADLGVDAILSSRNVVRYSTDRIGNTVVARNRGEGLYVGRLTLSIGSDGRVSGYESGSDLLDDKVPEDPTVKDMLDQYR